MPIQKTKLVVYKEHTLGYILPSSPKYIGVLRDLVRKGAPLTTNQYPPAIMITKKEDYRLASEEDFKEFGVSFDGYATDGFHEYAK